MSWKDNAIMFWWDDGQWNKITDHSREPLSISYERFETKNRMANATLRRYVVGKKRTFSANWTMLPAKTNAAGVGLDPVDGGWAGEAIEAFHDEQDGEFDMQLRGGDGQIETVTVMITDFSKDIEQRGPRQDLWSLSITLEEV